MAPEWAAEAQIMESEAYFLKPTIFLASSGQLVAQVILKFDPKLKPIWDTSSWSSIVSPQKNS